MGNDKLCVTTAEFEYVDMGRNNFTLSSTATASTIPWQNKATGEPQSHSLGELKSVGS